MKLKRMCAFLIMVFCLSGCVSDVSIQGTLENTKQAPSTVLTTQLTHRQNVQAVMNVNTTSNSSLKNEVETYALTKKLNKKLIEQEAVQSTLTSVMEKSEASQYEPPKPKEVVTTDVAASGDEFYVRTTMYGVDCYGCNVREDGTGNTATGVQLNPSWGVMQSDGTWVEGLTYDGYYVIAADGSIPFYSIVEISNHGLSGMGISPDQPLKCIVLDRGGGVNGNHIDLYIGSEANVGAISYNGSQAVAKVLRYGR